MVEAVTLALVVVVLVRVEQMRMRFVAAQEAGFALVREQAPKPPEPVIKESAGLSPRDILRKAEMGRI